MLKSIRFLCFSSCLALPLLAVAGGPDRMALPEPAAAGHILLGATFGGFKQANQGTAYGVLGAAFPILHAQGSLIRIPIDYHFGWGLHLGYLFSNNNDINLSFFTHDGRDNGEISPGAGQDVKVTKLPGGSKIISAEKAFSVVTDKTHLYQLTFGHRIYFSQNAFMLHPFFGVGFAKVWLDQQTTYDRLFDKTTLVGKQGLMSETSGFNGVGPLVGFDFAWRLGRYFSVVGSALWNGVIANIKQNYRAFTTNGGLSSRP